MCASIRTNVFPFSALSSKMPPHWVDLAAWTLAHSTVCLARWDLFEQQLAQMHISLSSWRGAISLRKTHFTNLPVETLISNFVCVLLCVIILWWLCVIIYHCTPLSSLVLSTEPALSESLTRTRATYINILLTRTVDCLLTKQKSYWQQPQSVYIPVYLCECVCVFVRQREGKGGREKRDDKERP